MASTVKGVEVVTGQEQVPGLRVNILGTLECWSGTRRIHLGGPVQERVIVALLLQSGQVLSVSQLVDHVWDEEPPATASHQVRKAVARLRQLIPGGRDLILTDGPGYRAAFPPEQVDLAIFTALLEKARRAALAQNSDEAVTWLENAVALRRGGVLGGSGGQVFQAAEVALQERFLDAVEQLADLRLSRGESRELIGELRRHVADNPLREKLRGQLMLALYRSGRQADALNEYRWFSRLLNEELGVDPGRELGTLHQRILRNDPALGGPALGEMVVADGPPGRAVKADEPRAVARTLPYDLADFVGREAELAALTAAVDHRISSGPRVIAIDGMGGVGKTSLAVRFAHLVADRYPDGQLALDLHGHTSTGSEMSSRTGVEMLLGMLGLEPDELPDDAESQFALWRTKTAKSRILVLLDNATDIAQVAPLLPMSEQSLTLVTSRTRLVDLDGAHWLTLATMTSQEAAMLASSILGQPRTAKEPGAVAKLAELCGHLPLALRIALNRLGNRPRWPIGHLVDRMSDESRRLDELKSAERGVELSLRISYDGLAPRNRTALRMLGLHPAVEFDVFSSAALLGIPAAGAESVLEVLLDAHMLQQQEIGYYTFHDLVRSFVSQLDQAESEEVDASEAETALERLTEYYVRVTDLVCGVLVPEQPDLQRGPAADVTELPRLTTAEAARQWIGREQGTLRLVADLAQRRGSDGHLTRLASSTAVLVNAGELPEDFAEVARWPMGSSRRVSSGGLSHPGLSTSAVAS